MSEQCDAIYENGVLRPLQPLNLPERTRVKVTIVSVEGVEYREYLRQHDGQQEESS